MKFLERLKNQLINANFTIKSQTKTCDKNFSNQKENKNGRRAKLHFAFIAAIARSKTPTLKFILIAVSSDYDSFDFGCFFFSICPLGNVDTQSFQCAAFSAVFSVKKKIVHYFRSKIQLRCQSFFFLFSAAEGSEPYAFDRLIGKFPNIVMNLCDASPL